MRAFPLSAPEMTPDMLRLIGEALFGPRWQADVGRLVGRTRGQVNAWAAGREPVPPDVPGRLRVALEARALAIADALRDAA